MIYIVRDMITYAEGKMRRLSRFTWTILIMLVLWTSFAVTDAAADVWKFGSSGTGMNPFTPRGYLVDTDRGQHWLSSPFDNSGTQVRYTGVKNGVNYLDAKQSDGSNYTFYAMTDRNPWTDKSSWVGYRQKFLFAYKNGERIADFNDYVQTPATRGDKVDPSGAGTCWVFKIEGFELEPGCIYEFGFLRGMQANNGITLVLAENENGKPAGYIQQTSHGLTAAEKAKYDREKYDEYEFISSWYEEPDGSGYTVNRVPMRFSVQTYADLSRWDEAAGKAQQFIDSVTDKELKAGKYKRENIDQLKALLRDLNKDAKDNVRYMLQTKADPQIDSMISQLDQMMQRAQSEKPEPSDMKALKDKIKAAKKLYDKASVNVGIDVGQYGQIEVAALRAEITRADTLDEYYPQSDINAEAKALQDAMTDVEASKVMKPQKIFYDKVTGIYVVAPEDSLPDDATFFVRIMDSETDCYKDAAKQLSESESEMVFFRMQFYEGDRKIQPSEDVEVQMPVTDNISEESSEVYAVGDGGGLEEMDSVKSGGVQFFSTGKIADFVMSGKAATDEEKAAARSEQLRTMIAQKQDAQQDDKNSMLEKEKKKKEEFKDPLDKILKRNANTATFSNDVKRQTDPFVLIIAAVLIAAVAVVLGIKGFINIRREREN